MSFQPAAASWGFTIAATNAGMASGFDPTGRKDRRSVRDGLAQLKARLAADLELQSEICRAIECVADKLPECDGALVKLLARIAEPSWREHVSLQERLLFPMLGRHRMPKCQAAQARAPQVAGHGQCQGEPITALIAAYTREHIEITRLAETATRCLEDLASGLGADSSGAECLRAFIEALRRHAASEQDMLVLLVPAKVAPIERLRTDALMWGHGWPQIRALPPRER